MAELCEFRRASKSRRAAADDGDTMVRVRDRFFNDGNLMLRNVIGGVALQASNFHRAAFELIDDAHAFAQNFGGADSRATGAENVCLQNDARGTSRVAVRNLADEGRDIDARGTGLDARSVETEQTAMSFDERLARFQRRVEVGKIGGEGLGARFGAQGHHLGNCFFGPANAG